MQLKHLSLVFICLLSFALVFQNAVESDLPLSWDVWYHLRISRQFTEGHVLWDSGSFGPVGRPHTYPPLFHGFTALLYSITGVSLETLARVLPSFLFAASILAFYILVKEVFNGSIALVSCLFASVSPILLDRGMSYTPEVLSFIFINLGLVFFWQGRWKPAGLLGGMIVLTHGISSAAFFSVLLVYCLISYFALKENYWKLFFQVCLLSFVISSFWIFRSFTSHMPYGGVHTLSYYPQKLGWIQTLLALLGIPFLSKNKKSLFILSYAVSLLLLSRNPVSLPYRFVEVLAFPVCILAGIGFYHINMSKNAKYFFVIFLIAFAQGYWYTEKYQPVISEEEKTAFVWLGKTSVEGYTVMSEWKTAPVLAYFSERATVKGAYEFGAFMLGERTKDTRLFYTEYPAYIVTKYNIHSVYYGTEERKYGYFEPPFDKVYSTEQTSFHFC